MFFVSTEFRKGIFFVRLVGRIDNEGYLDDIDKVVDDFGIRFVVLNIDNVHDLSVESIKNINDYNSEILKKKKKLYLCDNNIFRDRLFSFIPKIQNELDAFSLV